MSPDAPRWRQHVCSRPVLRRRSASITAPSTSGRSRGRWPWHLALSRLALPRASRGVCRIHDLVQSVRDNVRRRQCCNFNSALDHLGSLARLLFKHVLYSEQQARRIPVLMSGGISNLRTTQSSMRRPTRRVSRPAIGMLGACRRWHLARLALARADRRVSGDHKPV